MSVKKIVFIGAGNVAFHLAQTLRQKNYSICQIYNRTLEAAKALGNLCECSYTNDISDIKKDADIYIYALKDDVISEVCSKIEFNSGLHLHTAGSVDMQVFATQQSHYGVIYPLQTFTKNKSIKFDNIPIFVEANTENDLSIVKQMAESLSSQVQLCNSTQRLSIHLAAVISCNFSNYMYRIAAHLMTKNGMDFQLVLPLIQETVEKLQTLSPKEAQTGPAARNDLGTINRHLSCLAQNTEEAEIYKLLSEKIAQNKDW